MLLNVDLVENKIMELRNPKQSRRSRLESVSGGNSSHDLAYRIRYNDKSRDGSEKDSNSIGCNLMAMVRLAFSDPVLYRSSVCKLFLINFC